VTNTFQSGSAATSGPYAGHYLWSNSLNWTYGLPVAGSVVSDSLVGYEDTIGLDLGGLYLTAAAAIVFDVANLSVSDVWVQYAGATIVADADQGTPVTLTIGSIVGTGGYFGAAYAGAVADITAATDPGETYYVEYGGTLELHTPLNNASTLEYGGYGEAGTIALYNPTSTFSGTFQDINQGDVLELPGTSVTSVTFGASTLKVITNTGTYNFTDVSYYGPVDGYTVSHDANTGLEAITFLGTTTLEANAPATSGPYSGQYLWSNDLNWTDGIPLNGSNAITAIDSVDDVAGLDLAALTITASLADVEVVASLTVGNVIIDGEYASLVADAEQGGTVTVTVAGITNQYGQFGAIYAGATADITAASDPGNTIYYAEDGATLELHATPKNTSSLVYGDSGPPSTIALFNPAATFTGAFEDLASGDVLELPGTSVSSVTFGTSTLQVITNTGTYDFNDVTYVNGELGNYSVSHDASTGLEAITFLGSSTFQQNAAAGSESPLNGDYLWSNYLNWTAGIPVDGSTAYTPVVGFDDIAGLELGELYLSSDSAEVYVVANLTVSVLVQDLGTVVDADAVLGSPVTLTVADLGTSNGVIGASYTGAVADITATTDPGETYYIEYGGTVELHAPISDASTLEYGAYGETGTFALYNTAATPSSTVTFSGEFNFLNQGDVLELPGTSVTNVIFSGSTIEAITNTGTYAFTDVSDYGTVNAYSAAHDANTGLEAITFLGDTTFQQSFAATSGPYSGQYLWSNGHNWTDGIPLAGSTALTAVGGVDDIAGLNLGVLYLDPSTPSVDVVANLTVSYVFVEHAGAQLIADAGQGPVTMTVGGIPFQNGKFGAAYSGAIADITATTDPGDTTYFADFGGMLKLHATPNDSSTLAYDNTGPTSTIALFNPATSFTGALTNVRVGAVLELPGISVTSVTYGSNTLKIITSAGTYNFTNVSYYGTAPTNYLAKPDTATGLEAITFALCFCEGALLRTPSGDMPVESLSAGDMVVTWSGAHRRITWIGEGKVLATRGRRNGATPVIVRKGALADGVPHTDLKVTKGHSFLIDDVLIPVEFLVNHRSILWDDRAQEVSIYHVELESHDVLVANGAPAESYRDDGNRWLFRNANSAWDLAPQEPCVPVLTGGPVVDRAWRRLLDRAGAGPTIPLTDEPDLHLLVNGRRIEPVRTDGVTHLFRRRAGEPWRDVCLVSRAAAPDALGVSRDPRVLGVALQTVTVIAGTRHRTLCSSDECLCEGFHGYEPELDIRWTDGQARLPAFVFDGFDGEADVLVQLNGTTRYAAIAESLVVAA
jgi:hypothetical protein